MSDKKTTYVDPDDETVDADISSTMILPGSIVDDLRSEENLQKPKEVLLSLDEDGNIGDTMTLPTELVEELISKHLPDNEND